jgi:hypothetical protein
MLATPWTHCISTVLPVTDIFLGATMKGGSGFTSSLKAGIGAAHI